MRGSHTVPRRVLENRVTRSLKYHSSVVMDMPSRFVATLCLAILLPLAGCIGGPGDSKDAVVAPTPEATENATCAGSCSNLVAFEETNATEAGGEGLAHPHDMWNGRERVTIFETQAMMTPLDADPNYQAEATFNPPQGTFVFEGTEHVEFTIREPMRHVCPGGQSRLNGYYICHDTLDEIRPGAPALPAAPDPAGGPTGLKLRFKHASTINWIDAGELAWGTPTNIQITVPTQTDMPHATSSAWEFQVVSPNQYDSTLEFVAKAEIVRGVGDIPRWPGHPNFYAESNSRRVLDVDAVACDTSGCELPGSENAGPISPQKLISYGTRSLYVWVNISDSQAPVPPLAPSSWFLYHSNTTGSQNVTNTFDAAGHPVTQKEHFWILPVDDGAMDSPYADGSKWKFQLGGSLITPALSCYSGCAAWNAKYHIVIIATNQELPLEDYEMYCLKRTDYCPQPDA